MSLRTSPARAALVAVTVAVGATGLTACANENEPIPEVVVTVTSSASTSTSPSTATSPSATPAAVTSDVEGRDFDFGVVLRAEKEDGTDVLVVDRWTDPKVDDAVLAKKGLPVESWDLGSKRFVNQNTKKTFDVPVREGASFLLNHCVAAGEPLQTKSVSATELADAPEADRLVLLELDDAGYATAGETFAGC